MRNLINILFFSIVLTACTSAPNNDGTFYADFPLTIELKGKMVPLDTVLFRYPDFRYLSSLGRRGEAPEEMLSVENVRWNGDFLWMLDAGKSAINRFGSTWYV